MKRGIIFMAIAIIITTMTNCFQIPSKEKIDSYEKRNKETFQERVLIYKLDQLEEKFIELRKKMETGNRNATIDLTDQNLSKIFKSDTLLSGEEYSFTAKLTGYHSLFLKNQNPAENYFYKETEGSYEKNGEICISFIENIDTNQKFVSINIINEKDETDVLIERNTGLIILFYKKTKFIHKFHCSNNYIQVNKKGVKKQGKGYVKGHARERADEIITLVIESLSKKE